MYSVPTDPHSQSPDADSVVKKKLKIGNGNACELCRSKKVKCDGERPACGNCRKKRHICTYKSDAVALGLLSSIAGHGGFESTEASGQEQGTKCAGLGYSGSPSMFAGEVKAAIDAKCGGVSNSAPNTVPMSDAPLFGFQVSSRLGDGDADKVLPPRRQADELLDIFWKRIHPVDYFFDKSRFCRSYETLFAGRILEIDERVFISTLNIVFAFATQACESRVATERDAAASTYFQRAWNILRPECVLWEAPSLEIVECLLLMSRYLQCTNNPHQTWMAVGSAIRIAQSLGIHHPKASQRDMSSDKVRWQHHLWNRCVFADMTVSWVLGRTAITSLANRHCGSRGYADYLTETLELHEISRQTILAQTCTGGGLTDKFGFCGNYHKKESYCTVVVQHEACLSQWEKLRLNTLPSDDDDELRMRKLSLRLRLLHSRVLLFRPMVARCCFPQQNSRGASVIAVDFPYKNHMIQYGALQCVKNAQEMISLIHDNSDPGKSFSVLPWWYRIFYLHIGGTVLLAAMQCDELFTQAASESWQQTLVTLRKHEHLSPYISQCLSLFHSLSRKTSEIRDPGRNCASDDSSYAQFQDIFQDFGFSVENLFFDDGSLPWLNAIPNT